LQGNDPIDTDYKRNIDAALLKRIKTKNLLLTLATSSDLPEIKEIEDECDEYFRFDPPSAGDHNRSLRDCLIMGDMIPGVSEESYKTENYYLYCIRKDNVLVGWLSFYLEYQQKDTAYLSVVYIKEMYRSSGIGTEIVDALARKLAASQFRIIKTHCSLRNALSLRFWVKSGFDRITEVEPCTGNLYPDNWGGLGLMKRIDRGE